MATFPSMQTRQEIFDATTRITQLTQQPSDFLTGLLVQQQQYTSIEWISRFNLLAKIPSPPDSISYLEAAAQIGVSESTLRAVARMAITANLLGETKDGRLMHNSISIALVENESLATWFSYLIKRSVPCMRAYPEATSKWSDSADNNKVAYNVAFNTDLSFFQHLKANPVLGAEFDGYMKSQSLVNTATSASYLSKGFDWEALGKAKIVDVGGNEGHVSIALAKEFSHLKFVIQDQEGPIRDGRIQAAELPEGIRERIEFQEHDFFQPQPVKDADVYLLRMILHDWPDADAAKILRGLSGSMESGSRIVVMDMVLPTPGTTSRTFEAAQRVKDLTMRQVLNARERELEDWNALVASADGNLSIVAVRRPEGCLHSVIEIKRSE